MVLRKKKKSFKSCHLRRWLLCTYAIPQNTINKQLENVQVWRDFPPPRQKHCSLKEAGFSVATPAVQKAHWTWFWKQNKVKTLGGIIVQCGVLSLSYKEKKKSYLVPKCATYRPSGTALWLLCMISQGCQVPVFLELGVGGLASAETMHKIGLLNKTLLRTSSKTAE